MPIVGFTPIAALVWRTVGVSAQLVSRGRSSISDQVGFDDTLPMRIDLIDLESFETVQTLETDPGAIIHLGNTEAKYRQPAG